MVVLLQAKYSKIIMLDIDLLMKNNSFQNMTKCFRKVCIYISETFLRAKCHLYQIHLRFKSMILHLMSQSMALLMRLVQEKWNNNTKNKFYVCWQKNFTDNLQPICHDRDLPFERSCQGHFYYERYINVYIYLDQLNVF